MPRLRAPHRVRWLAQRRVDIVSIIDATGGLVSGRMGLSVGAAPVFEPRWAAHTTRTGGSRGCVWRSAWGGGGGKLVEEVEETEDAAR